MEDLDLSNNEEKVEFSESQHLIGVDLNTTSQKSQKSRPHQRSLVSQAQPSLTESWNTSMVTQEPMKLLLPDMKYRPFYLPVSKFEKILKCMKDDERTRVRDEFLCLKESENIRVEKQILKLPPKLKLCLGDRVVENRLMEPYKSDFAREALMARAERIEKRWRLEDLAKRKTFEQEKQQLRESLGPTAHKPHAHKVQQMNQLKEAAHAERLQQILAAMDQKSAQYQNEVAAKKALLSMKDIQKIQKWMVIVKVMYFTVLARDRIELIRLQKKTSGPKYVALIKIQNWFRDLLAYRRKALLAFNSNHSLGGEGDEERSFNDLLNQRRRSLRVTWRTGLQNLKAHIIETNHRDTLNERMHACTVLISFIRSVSRCFRGYVHKFILKVINLQRMIRRHQRRNIERSNLLLLMLERGLLPIVNHIRIVASGKSFASKSLTEVEAAVVARMAAKYTDPLKIVADMQHPSFHKMLHHLFPSEVKHHARHMRLRADFHSQQTNTSNYHLSPDFPLPIKRRVVLDYYYQFKRATIRKKYEDKYRVVIAPVTLEEVREFVHSPRPAPSFNDRDSKNDGDPLSKKINDMLELQDKLRRGGVKENDGGVGGGNRSKNMNPFKNCIYCKVVTGLTPQAFAQLYFDCNSMYMEFLRSMQDDGQNDNENDEDDDYDDESDKMTNNSRPGSEVKNGSRGSGSSMLGFDESEEIAELRREATEMLLQQDKEKEKDNTATAINSNAADRRSSVLGSSGKQPAPPPMLSKGAKSPSWKIPKLTKLSSAKFSVSSEDDDDYSIGGQGQQQHPMAVSLLMAPPPNVGTGGPAAPSAAGSGTGAGGGKGNSGKRMSVSYSSGAPPPAGLLKPQPPTDLKASKSTFNRSGKR